MAVINISSNRVVEQLKPAIVDGKVRQAVYFDKTLKGFGIVVGKQAKTFFAQRRIDGKIVRKKLDKFGPISTVAEARERARNWLHDAGLPFEERQKKIVSNVTLRDAWTRYQQYMKAKNRSATTFRNYDGALKLYLDDWMDRPLARITREQVQDRHHKLAEEIEAGKFATKGRARKGRDGKTTANFALSVFRLIYIHAAKTYPSLPTHPTIAVSWYELEKPRTSMSNDDLKAWWQAVNAINQTIRSDLLKFMLMTGLRRGSAQVMKWEHIDFDQKLLHIPDPKGGKKHAFDLPLAQWHIDLLRARQQETLAEGIRSQWVWPSLTSGKGHITEPWTELPGVRHVTLHDLRRTFATTGAKCIPFHLLSVLLNHTQPKGVTGGYVNLEAGDLRASMDTIVARLLAIVEADPPSNVVPMRHRKTAA